MIRKTSYEAAIDNISRWGDTDVFPKPLENHVMKDERDKFLLLVQEFGKNVDLNLANGVSLVKSAVPNGYAGFRWATQLDPVLNAYLLGAAINLFSDFEPMRLSQDWVTSHRREKSTKDARLFTEDGYARFLTRSSDLAESSSHVVVTDIADFYGRVYHHRLENALQSVPKISGLQKKINVVLGRISGNKSYGLPIGGPAARVFAEALLDRTDHILASKGIQFVRYSDDYRLFASSEDEAHGQLATLAEVLAVSEGLSLQKSKTRVLTRAEFLGTMRQPSRADLGLNGTQLSARQLLNFQLRYDPYSPTAEADFELLKDEIDKIDLVDLFSVELGKSRVDIQFTKKLLRALQYSSNSTKSSVAESLTLNLALLAPVMPQTMAAIKGLWADLTPTTRAVIVEKIQQLQMSDSYLLRPGVTRSYVVRILAEDRTIESELVLSNIFDDRNSDDLVRRDVILAMAARSCHWWLSDRLQRFGELRSSWERRAFLAATQVMTEEAIFFVNKIRNSLTPFELLTLDWAAAHKKAMPTWTPPI